MKRRTIIGIIIAYVAIMAVVYTVLLHGHTVAIFSTEGTIADQEKGLILFTVLLGCTIVIPVLVMIFVIAWRYREGNTKAVYRPEWSGSNLAEAIWWLIPTIVIAILGIVIFQSTHALDPYKELASTQKALRVQVVALQWRWLFIYPDEHVATINYMKFPVNTPVDFTITSDAPMNSFWIPQLSGQVYAMSGMSTQLHLAARSEGAFRGSSANISGLGFAGMTFSAQATSMDSFTTWASQLRQTATPLDKKIYDGVAEKTSDTSQYSFKLTDADLYNEVIEKYMAPASANTNNASSDASSAAPSTMKTMTMEGM